MNDKIELGREEVNSTPGISLVGQLLRKANLLTEAYTEAQIGDRFFFWVLFLGTKIVMIGTQDRGQALFLY